MAQGLHRHVVYTVCTADQAQAAAYAKGKPLDAPVGLPDLDNINEEDMPN